MISISLLIIISAMASISSAFSFSSSQMHRHPSIWGFSSGASSPPPPLSVSLPSFQLPVRQKGRKLHLKSTSNSDSDGNEIENENEIEMEGLTIPINSNNNSKLIDLSKEWAGIIQRDGVLKIKSALTADLADALRYYIEDQKILAWFAGMEGEEAAAKRVFYGGRHQGRHQHQKDDEDEDEDEDKEVPVVESYANPAPVTDLQLSLLRGGYAGDYGKNVTKTERHILADVLLDVLGPEEGKLTPLLEELVSSEAMMCELAAFVTEPVSVSVSDRGDEDDTRMVLSSGPGPGDESDSDSDSDSSDSDSDHNIYSIALALDDITEHMGPMKYSLRSTSEESSNGVQEVHVGTMKKGDAIVYDARLLRSQGANDATAGSTQTSFLMNISFQNSNLANANASADPQSRAFLLWASQDATRSTELFLPSNTNANGAGDGNGNESSSNGSLRPGYRDSMSLGDLTNALLDYDNGNGDAFEKYGDGMSKNFHNTESSPPPSEFL